MRIPEPTGPDIIEFATSRKYLGGAVPELSIPQRAILKALYGLDMDRDERLAFLEMSEGREPRKGGYEEAALICGVRGGKTMLGALVAVYESVRWGPTIADTNLRLLMPGQVATGILIAQDRNGAATARGYIVGFLHELEERTGATILQETEGQAKSVTGQLVKLRWPIQIAVYSANAYSVRGVTGLWFIGDESAWWKSEEGAYNQDVKVWKAVRSRFATLARLRPKRLLLSSPNEEQGVLYDEWKKRETSKALVIKAPTWVLNPSIEQEFLDKEQEKDPDGFMQEYGAEFGKPEGGNIFLPPEVIDNCVERGVIQRAPEPGREYVAWIDAAFKKDRFVFGIGHLDAMNAQSKVIIDHLRSWTPRTVKGRKTRPLDDDEIVTEIAKDLKVYTTDRVHGDQHCDVVLKGKFQKAGIQFVEAPVSDPEKNEAFKNLRGALRSGLVSLLDVPELVKDLKGLIKSVSKTGHVNIQAPKRKGCYDDAANVAARLVSKLMPSSGHVDVVEVNEAARKSDSFPGLDWRQPPREGEFHGGLMEAVY